MESDAITDAVPCRAIGHDVQSDRQFERATGSDGRVMDGMHRIARALLEGRATITALRLRVLPDPITGTGAQTSFRTEQEATRRGAPELPLGRFWIGQSAQVRERERVAS